MSKNNKDKPAKKNLLSKQERLDKSLYRAACSGNSFMVRQIIHMGANVDYHDRENGETPLHAAVASGSAVTVKDLIQLGANVNLADNSGKTPLFFVDCEKYSEKIVALLLQAKADPDKPDNLGRPPLAAIISDMEMMSQESGGIRLLKALYAAGANVDATDDHNNTVLVWSLLHGFQRMSQQLIDFGASFDHTNYKNKTVIQYASMSANWKMLSVMLMKQNPEWKTTIEESDEDEFSDTTLNYLKFCYEHADFDNPDGWAQYLFYGACDNGTLTEIMFLVDQGLSRFDMNLDGMYGDRILHILCMRKRKELIRWVLEAGANPNLVNDNGLPPIACMTDRPDLSIQELLYEHGFNPNVSSKNKLPFITYLALNAKADQLRLALKYGKKPNLRSDEGFTLLMLVGNALRDKSGDYDDEYYDNNSGPKDVALDIALQEAVLETVKVLVEAGADINFYPSDAAPTDVAAFYLQRNGFTLAADYLRQLPQAKPVWAEIG